MRTDPFPPPADPTRPDVDWALRVLMDWEESGREDLDGPPLDQKKIADAVFQAFLRATE